ncbi:MAG: hypothetical protein LBN06_02485 [Prevotellaceae bacterium]|jgi:type IV pilus assembly protein PilQ|nr:hypothetical protein [Prevotellaceae bacterium]
MKVFLQTMLVLTGALCLHPAHVRAQQAEASTGDSLYLAALSDTLENMARTDSTYLLPMDVSVSNMLITELFTNIAQANGVNIAVTGDGEKRITCSFRQIPLAEFIYFICREHRFGARSTGSILTLFPYRAPVAEPPLTVHYDTLQKCFSFDLRQAKLANVARRIGEVSGINLIIPQTMYEQRISTFGQAMKAGEMVQALTVANGLGAQKKNETTWEIYAETTHNAEGGLTPSNRLQGADTTTVRSIPMRYRTVEKIPDIVPAELKKEVEMIVFPDQNSLIVSGMHSKVERLSSFLRQIDRSIPLISIDVIIVDATDNNTLDAGISFGKGTEAVTSTGALSPGVDLSLGAGSINRLIRSFNGFGSINLGQVSPNFYLDLKLLEENGKVMLRSTPRLSTLNGHKATLKSGEIKYYKESQTSIIGSQSPMQTESYQWKNVEANLSLEITPYVSLDSCITMQIELTQNEFTERESQDAPPGTTTRSFNSIIKVNNEETVLLGGIERNLAGRTGKGLPFIARIPVLRWLFGRTTRTKNVQKLNVFIKPTIIP